MNFTRKIAQNDTTNKMTVAFDVSMGKVNYYSQLVGKLAGNSCHDVEEVENEIPNRTQAITVELNKLYSLCRERGHDGLHVVCEPTGSYSNALMSLARKMGHSTAYVSGECVSKARVIENNDNGKDDVKDPRIIYMLSKMGKELRFRDLPPEYRSLRRLNHLYDGVDVQRTQARCELHALIVQLFCDFPMSKDFVYDDSGKVLMEEYRFSPYRIIADTREEFSAKMRRGQPRILKSTLVKLYAAAQCSARHCMSPQEQQALQQQIRYVWEDYVRADTRKRELRKQFEESYQRLWDAGEQVPQADEKHLKAFFIARLVGETGPLSDFPNWQVLFKFSGLNLRKRESGMYKGKLKLSKKGRTPVRRVAGRAIFGMVRKGQLYGDYYHGRKEKNPEESGTKLMANAERKLVKLFFALSRRREAFNEERFKACESAYRKAA